MKLLLLVADAQVGIKNNYYHPTWFIQRLTILLKQEAIEDAKKHPTCDNCINYQPNTKTLKGKCRSCLGCDKFQFNQYKFETELNLQLETLIKGKH